MYIYIHMARSVVSARMKWELICKRNQTNGLGGVRVRVNHVFSAVYLSIHLYVCISIYI